MRFGIEITNFVRTHVSTPPGYSLVRAQRRDKHNRNHNHIVPEQFVFVVWVSRTTEDLSRNVNFKVKGAKIKKKNYKN